MKINGIEITSDYGASRAELEKYLEFVRSRVPNVVHIDVHLQGDEVELRYTAANEKFERIRRITGYLVGTTDRWNDAKQAEEQDRVKHGGLT